jgi:hypothetical protein
VKYDLMDDEKDNKSFILLTITGGLSGVVVGVLWQVRGRG